MAAASLPPTAEPVVPQAVDRGHDSLYVGQEKIDMGGKAMAAVKEEQRLKERRESHHKATASRPDPAVAVEVTTTEIKHQPVSTQKQAEGTLLPYKAHSVPTKGSLGGFFQRPPENLNGSFLEGLEHVF